MNEIPVEVLFRKTIPSAASQLAGFIFLLHDKKTNQKKRALE